MENKLKSDCCGAEVRAEGNTTMCYVCEACQKPCDVINMNKIIERKLKALNELFNEPTCASELLAQDKVKYFLSSALEEMFKAGIDEQLHNEFKGQLDTAKVYIQDEKPIRSDERSKVKEEIIAVIERDCANLDVIELIENI